MRRALLVTFLLTTATACSQSEQRTSREDLKTFDVEEAPASTDSASPPAPGVDVTAAPGVAFNYRYAFQLPSGRVSAAQEAHATACEKLGLDRCRITGMRYRLVGQRDVEAMLALRLDPTIARAFGKQATDVITQAQGLLVDQEITGEDVGSRIKSATRSESQLRADLAKIEADLRIIKATDSRRGELVARADELKRQIAALSQARSGDEEALAGTPMVFRYGSGDVIPELDTRSPIRNALRTAADSFTMMISFALLLVASLLPWAILLGLVWWVIAQARKRFGSGGSSGSYRSEASTQETS
jgi:hypothetical protein